MHTTQKTEEAFRDYLDDIYPAINIGPVKDYPVSLALKEVDPIVYRCAFVDWMDFMDIDENDGED